MSFDVIIGKLDVAGLTEAEHTDHFEMTILARYPKLQGDQVGIRIQSCLDSFLRRIEMKLEQTLKERRKERKHNAIR